jgi:antitoxin component of MazEF toxin-antitoxin module
MGYKTKVQRIDRENSKQHYVNMPSAIAQSMNLKKGECFEWSVEDRDTLILKRCKKQRRGLLQRFRGGAIE